MYILELRQWEIYEYDRTISIAISESDNKLKELALENKLIFDEQWEFDSNNKSVNLVFEKQYYEDKTELYSCQEYIIRRINQI